MPTNAITPIVVLTEAVLKTIEEYDADRVLYFTLQGDSDSQTGKCSGAWMRCRLHCRTELKSAIFIDRTYARRRPSLESLPPGFNLNGPSVRIRCNRRRAIHNAPFLGESIGKVDLGLVGRCSTDADVDLIFIDPHSC